MKEKKPQPMDPECLALCDAINAIPGLKTHSSCSGHGKEPFRIWFCAETVRSLFILVRHLDTRYGAPVGWTCQVEDTDLVEEPVVFMVERQYDGPQIYGEADRISGLIQDFLANDRFMSMWGL
jgi:hypothetical protein